MKRITTKEILIQIETIRLTKKRSVRKNAPAQQPKTDVPNSAERRVKTDAALERIFNEF